MKKQIYFLSAVLTWQVIVLLFVISCSQPEPQLTCNCYKRIYFQHLENPIQFLFQEPAQMDQCNNWTIGDDTKTDDNGYLYNYLKVCE